MKIYHQRESEPLLSSAFLIYAAQSKLVPSEEPLTLHWLEEHLRTHRGFIRTWCHCIPNRETDTFNITFYKHE